MGLFVNMPPNNRAFCSTLETFLHARGFKLATQVISLFACRRFRIININETQDTLRVRFGNALEWYTSLHQAMRDKIDNLLDAARELAREEDSGTPRASTPLPPAHGSSPLPPSSPRARASSPLPPSSPPVAALSSPSAPSGQKRQRAPDSDESDDGGSDDDDDCIPSNPNRLRNLPRSDGRLNISSVVARPVLVVSSTILPRRWMSKSVRTRALHRSVGVRKVAEIRLVCTHALCLCPRRWPTICLHTSREFARLRPSQLRSRPGRTSRTTDTTRVFKSPGPS